MKTKSVPERALYLEFEDDDGRVYPVTVRLKQGDPAAAVEAAATIATAFGKDGLRLMRVTPTGPGRPVRGDTS